ncbi:MAG TPA: hypothetical protein VFF73_14505 [Planctomycetota bacterium]|nr:hypothetical protein [Planctomycetota bacterium]
MNLNHPMSGLQNTNAFCPPQLVIPFNDVPDELSTPTGKQYAVGGGRALGMHPLSDPSTAFVISADEGPWRVMGRGDILRPGRRINYIKIKRPTVGGRYGLVTPSDASRLFFIDFFESETNASYSAACGFPAAPIGARTWTVDNGAVNPGGLVLVAAQNNQRSWVRVTNIGNVPHVISPAASGTNNAISLDPGQVWEKALAAAIFGDALANFSVEEYQ